ncbi:MAG: DUF5717 family protein [Lachnospiraceae bacterium]
MPARGIWSWTSICRLALLKYYSGLDHLTQEQEELIGRMMEECGERGLRFSFMKNLPGVFAKSWQLDDKQFVEEKLPRQS